MAGLIEFLIFAVVVAAAAIALATLRSRTRAYDEIGEGGLALDRPPAPEAGGRGTALEDEVRTLVIAANERRARRGEPELDVEAEVTRRLEARS